MSYLSIFQLLALYILYFCYYLHLVYFFIFFYEPPFYQHFLSVVTYIQTLCIFLSFLLYFAIFITQFFFFSIYYVLCVLYQLIVKTFFQLLSLHLQKNQQTNRPTDQPANIPIINYTSRVDQVRSGQVSQKVLFMRRT